MPRRLTVVPAMRRLFVWALTVLVPVRLWFLEPHVVRGTSMWPTLADGDYVLVDKLSLRFRPLARGDVVVLRLPHQPHALLMKRVAGLPGETVTVEDGVVSDESPARTGRITVDESHAGRRGEQFWRGTLAAGEILVLGDHRSASVDSRAFGAIPIESVVGRVLMRLGRLPRFLR